MKTLDLHEAAEFLRMNPQVLRRKAYNGEIPGRKTGKCWLFIQEHLADWVSGRYCLKLLSHPNGFINSKM